MSDLDQAATERLADFRDKLLDYKHQNDMTLRQLSEECEVNLTSIHRFLSRDSSVDRLLVSNLLKISMATGIPL